MDAVIADVVRSFMNSCTALDLMGVSGDRSHAARFLTVFPGP